MKILFIAIIVSIVFIEYTDSKVNCKDLSLNKTPVVKSSIPNLINKKA